MKMWNLALCLAVLAIPTLARADHHEVFVQDVILLSSNSCAVELEIDADAQDQFEDVDRIEIDGFLLADLGAEAGVINAGGNFNAGDTILFASNGFVAETGLDADVSFDDSECSAFVSGAEVAFVLDDLEFGGPGTVIDSVILPSGFGVDTAAFRASQGSAVDLRILDNETILVSNNSGQEILLGNDSNGGGGGCRLGPGYSNLSWPLLLTALLALGLTRKLVKS